MDSYKTFCSRKNTRLSYRELYKDACGSRGYDAEAEQAGNVQRKPASLPQAVSQNLLFSIHSSVCSRLNAWIVASKGLVLWHQLVSDIRRPPKPLAQFRVTLRHLLLGLYPGWRVGPADLLVASPCVSEA